MAVNLTINVFFDTAAQVVTLTGGNTDRNDGSVNADWGSGNTITFVPAGTNTADWQLTNITWTPTEPKALAWAWSNNQPNTSIVVSDDNELPPRSTAVSYSYTLFAQNKRTGRTLHTDPSIINKPANGMMRRMGNY